MLNEIYRLFLSLGYVSPIHPPLTHIPIGLVTGALIFAIASRVLKSPGIASVARACSILALIFALMAMAAGVMDWQYYYSGGRLHPISMKLIIAGALLGLLCIAVVLGLRAGYQATTLSLLAVYALCFLAVTGLGWFGDKLTYSARIDGVPDEARPGALLFVNSCWGCHPDGGNLVAPLFQLRTSEKLVDRETFVGWIRSPGPPMPAFAQKRISNEQAGILYTFITEYVRTGSDE